MDLLSTTWLVMKVGQVGATTTIWEAELPMMVVIPGRSPKITLSAQMELGGVTLIFAEPASILTTSHIQERSLLLLAYLV